jgi:GAF domain-containing protein
VYDDDGQLTAIEGIARDITERKAADEALRQRTQEVGLLYEAGRQLSSTLDLRRVYTTFYQMAARAMDCSGLLVSSYNSEDNLIRCVYGIHEGEELDVSGFPPLPLEPEESGLQSEVIRRGEPLLVADYVNRNKNAQTVYRYDVGGLLDDGEVSSDPDEVRSALITPLKLDGAVVGVVQIFSFRLNAYTPEHLRFLEALALLTAAAAHNARLYAQAQQEVNERRRAEEAYQHAVVETQHLNRRLSTLYEIGLALVQAVDLRQVYRVVYEHVARLADCSYFAISRFDALKRTLHMDYALVDGEEVDKSEFPPFTFDENVTPRGRGKALFTGQPVLLSDMAERFMADVRSGKGKLVGGGLIPDSAFYIPLISAGQVIGLMELQSYQSNAYNQDKVALLGATANQIALAIERAGLYEQTRASLGEKEVLIR